MNSEVRGLVKRGLFPDQAHPQQVSLEIPVPPWLLDTAVQGESRQHGEPAVLIRASCTVCRTSLTHLTHGGTAWRGCTTSQSQP